MKKTHLLLAVATLAGVATLTARAPRKPRLLPLVGLLQHCHYQPALEDKTELCVKRGSYRIITIQMQKWRLAAPNDLSNKCTN